MYTTRIILTAYCIAMLMYPAFCQNFGGNPAAVKWKQIDTRQSRVIFPNGLDSQANRISHIMHMLDTTTLYSIGNNIRKWNVVLQHQNIVPNAYVRLAPVISELYLTPDPNNFTNGSLRWDDNLIIHEKRHMQQFSNFNNGLTRVFSFLLGQEGQLLANGISIPDYFFEGDAVFHETLVSQQGRGRMPAFFNGMKAMVIDKKNYSWMKMRSGSLRHYTPDYYELGYQVVAYGYEKYGSDFWRKVTRDAVQFKGIFYAFNRAIQKHSGTSYSGFRQDALRYFSSQTLPDTANLRDTNAYITGAEKNNVTDYLFPQYVSEDTIIVTKKSYREINSFYFLTAGREQKIRVKDLVLDDYFSYANGKLVYAAYQLDPRWTNRSYSVIQLLDIYSRQQKQLSFKSRYFSPDISADGSEVLAVQVHTDGSSSLHRISTENGEVLAQVPNPNRYFFTQTRYIDRHRAVTAVRNTEGQMALLAIQLANGQTDTLLPFSYNILGYPYVHNGKVYLSMTDNSNGNYTDRIFSVSLDDKTCNRLTTNNNGVYHPAVSTSGKLVYTAFTSYGYRLAVQDSIEQKRLAQSYSMLPENNTTPAAKALQLPGAAVLDKVDDTKALPVTKYHKSFRLFNFHSARPFATDPEYGYAFYSDNILSTFSNVLTYTYNRNEQSHAAAFDAVFAGWFPFLRIGLEQSFNRKVDTGIGGKSFNYNAAKLSAGFSIPLNFVRGRTIKYINVGSGLNRELIPYALINGKTVETKSFDYLNAFIIVRNRSQVARQHINPRWAQALTVTYREALSITNNQKLVANASLNFPGITASHSLVVDGALQKRDTLIDFFSKTFSTPRGYQELNTQHMYKWGINYHFPLLYPDCGVGNIVFIQRIRANAFYDYGMATARLRGGGTRNINNRSTGGELYFDTKIWNALPVSVGIRYSHLLDRDLLNPGASGRWEVFLPFNIIPD
ncbi:MAG TPA: hypothetical protein PKC39_09285 [Ferruginibacter sp.]|nr:hypothetical protein [Ferruginibacter sp.]HMP21139.1 hypothetical protein [Ferruginibacter sp.]